jgi:hypothetical protein
MAGEKEGISTILRHDQSLGNFLFLVQVASCILNQLILSSPSQATGEKEEVSTILKHDPIESEV